MSVQHAPFVHLRVHSSYSLAEGALKPGVMADLCVKHAMPAVAITDTNNLFGSLEFSNVCCAKGVQPIIGCLLNVRAETASSQQAMPQKAILDKIVLYAKNEEGYGNLLKLASKAYRDDPEGLPPFITQRELIEHNAGLIALTAGTEGILGRLLFEGQSKEALKVLLMLKRTFGDRLYIELQRHGLEEQEAIEPSLIELAYQHDVPLVATNDVFFPERSMYMAHDALLCIAEGRYVSEDDRRKLTPEHYFKSPKEMEALFVDIPEAIENTLIIAKRCAVKSPERKPILPHFSTEAGRNEAEELRKQAKDGLEERLQIHVYTENMDEKQKAKIAKPYYERLEYELGIIIGMDFPGYFLIVSDFIKWSKQQGIPVGPGRGSGAGSVVAWSLQITDLDPLRFGLLFERFLNPERVSMPDFDVDFCQDRRGEVIRYVQHKYGHDKVAQIITFGKLQAKAVVRDVGRVLQMPYGHVDKISKLIPNNPANPVTLSEAITMEPLLRKARDDEPEVAALLDMALKLEGLNRHASVHAAGVVIGDRPLYELVALYRDPRSDMPVVQYSMKYAESSGLVKFDFLGLKTLTVISRACDFVNQRKADNEKVDITKIPLDDKATFDMLSRGESVGVFQLESAGMRDTLRKLKPDTLEEVIALISLYRPGPMDNIPSYIARKYGQEEPDYLHPLLEDILKETFGVIIYQEQVMQIAQVLSGYTLGGADLLRRAMGKKIKAEMDKQRALFVDGAEENKVDRKQADGIFDLVAKFAGYGFNKSHAAAYALISYQTAWLKANYPVEFLAASMNLDIQDTDKIDIFRQEAARSKIALLPPDINRSQAYFSVEQCDDGSYGIRYGLAGLKNVGLAAMQEMVEIRKNHGAFKDIFDFASECGGRIVNKRQLESLIKAGAFANLSENRKQLYESVDIITAFSNAATKERESAQASLFGDGSSSQTMPTPALQEVNDWSSKEKLHNELESLGFYLSAHPLDSYQAVLTKAGAISSAELMDKLVDGTTQIYLAGMVMGRRIRVSPRGRFAYVQLSDASGSYEVAIFDEGLLNENTELLEAGNAVLLTVEARKDEGGVRLIAAAIQSIEDVAADQSLKLRILIEDIDVLESLKSVIGEAGNGKASLDLSIMVDNQEVQIDLPGVYRISARQLDDMQQMEGIKVMEEA